MEIVPSTPGNSNRRPSQPQRSLPGGRKNTAIDDFRQRLKNRYQQFKKSLDDDEDQDQASNVGRGSVTSFGRVSNRRQRQLRHRSGTYDKNNDDDDKEEEEEKVEVIQPTKSFRSRSGSVGNRRFRGSSSYRERNRSNNRYNKNKDTSNDKKEEEEEEEETYQAPSSSSGRTYGNKRRKEYNRFRNRGSSRNSSNNSQSSTSSSSFR